MTASILIFTAMISLPADDPDFQRASKYARHALWKEYEVDKMLRAWEKRHVSKELRKTLSPVFTFGRAIYEQRVSLRWEF